MGLLIDPAIQHPFHPVLSIILWNMAGDIMRTVQAVSLNQFQQCRSVKYLLAPLPSIHPAQR